MKKFLLIFGLLVAYTFSQTTFTEPTELTIDASLADKDKYLELNYLILTAAKGVTGTCVNENTSGKWPLVQFEGTVEEQRGDTNTLTFDHFFTKVKGFDYMVYCKLTSGVYSKIKCSFSSMVDFPSSEILTGDSSTTGYVIDPFNKVIFTITEGKGNPLACLIPTDPTVFTETVSFTDSPKMFIGIAKEKTLTYRISGNIDKTLTAKIPFKEALFGSVDSYCQWDQTSDDLICQATLGTALTSSSTDDFSISYTSAITLAGSSTLTFTAMVTGEVVYNTKGFGGIDVFKEGDYKDLISIGGNLAEQEPEKVGQAPDGYTKVTISTVDSVDDASGEVVVTMTIGALDATITSFDLKFKGLPTATCAVSGTTATCTIPAVQTIDGSTTNIDLVLEGQKDDRNQLYIPELLNTNKKITTKVEKKGIATGGTPVDLKKVQGFLGFVSENYIEFRLTPKDSTSITGDLYPVYLNLKHSTDVVLCTPVNTKKELICKGKLTNPLAEGDSINYERYSDGNYGIIEPMERDLVFSLEEMPYDIYSTTVDFTTYIVTLFVNGANDCLFYDFTKTKCLECKWNSELALVNGELKCTAKAKTEAEPTVEGDCKEVEEDTEGHCTMCGFMKQNCIQCEKGYVTSKGKCVKAVEEIAIEIIIEDAMLTNYTDDGFVMVTVTEITKDAPEAQSDKGTAKYNFTAKVNVTFPNATDFTGPDEVPEIEFETRLKGFEDVKCALKKDKTVECSIGLFKDITTRTKLYTNGLMVDEKNKVIFSMPKKLKLVPTQDVKGTIIVGQLTLNETKAYVGACIPGFIEFRLNGKTEEESTLNFIPSLMLPVKLGEEEQLAFCSGISQDLTCFIPLAKRLEKDTDIQIQNYTDQFVSIIAPAENLTFSPDGCGGFDIFAADLDFSTLWEWEFEGGIFFDWTIYQIFDDAQLKKKEDEGYIVIKSAKPEKGKCDGENFKYTFELNIEEIEMGKDADTKEKKFMMEFNGINGAVDCQFQDEKKANCTANLMSSLLPKTIYLGGAMMDVGNKVILMKISKKDGLKVAEKCEVPKPEKQEALSKTEALFGQCQPYYFNFVLKVGLDDGFKGFRPPVNLKLTGKGLEDVEAYCQWHWMFNFLICQANPQGLEGEIEINFEPYESPFFTIEPLEEPLVFKEGECDTGMNPWGEFDFTKFSFAEWIIKFGKNGKRKDGENEDKKGKGKDGEDEDELWGKGKKKYNCRPLKDSCMVCQNKNKCKYCDWWYEVGKDGRCKLMGGIPSPKPKKGLCKVGKDGCAECGWGNYMCVRCEEGLQSFWGGCWSEGDLAEFSVKRALLEKQGRILLLRKQLFFRIKLRMRAVHCGFPLFGKLCLVCARGFKLDAEFKCKSMIVNIVKFSFRSANPFLQPVCVPNKGITFQIGGQAEPDDGKPTGGVQTEESKEIKSAVSFVLPMGEDHIAKCTITPQGDTAEPLVDCNYDGDVDSETTVSADTDGIEQDRAFEEDRDEPDEDDDEADGGESENESESESETTPTEGKESDVINGPETQRLRRAPIRIRRVKLVYASGLSQMKINGFGFLARAHIKLPVCRRPAPTPEKDLKYLFSHFDGYFPDTSRGKHGGFKFFTHAMTNSIIRVSNFITMKVIIKRSFSYWLHGTYITESENKEVESKCEPVDEVDGTTEMKTSDFDCFVPKEEAKEDESFSMEGINTDNQEIKETMDAMTGNYERAGGEEEEEEGGEAISERRLRRLPEDSGMNMENLDFTFGPSTMARAAMGNNKNKFFVLNKLTPGECNTKENSYTFTAEGKYKDILGKTSKTDPLTKYDMTVKLGDADDAETYPATCKPVDGSSTKLACKIYYSKDLSSKLVPKDFDLISGAEKVTYFLRNEGNESTKKNIAKQDATCTYINTVPKSSSNGLSGGAIAAIVIASVVLIAAIAFVIIYLNKRGKKHEVSVDGQNTISAAQLNN